ncbi:helix-turn-helix domain-containing protein [Amycolatopsis sp. NPDC059090]|uniref:helix-turn-helix domain-containing protein n=1 Tax=unclassified Amycolatopsis TaxID=2618356 RepID=UPI00367015F8
MAQDYRDGKTITAIAAAYGLLLSWTGRILRQQGVAMPPMRQGVKRELNVAQVVRDYQRGATIQTVASTHHASYGTIRRLLLREKVAIRPHGGQNAITPVTRVIAASAGRRRRNR